MNEAVLAEERTVSLNSHSPARLQGLWLLIARIVWIAVALLTVGTLVLASYIDHTFLSTLDGWSLDAYAKALASLGLSANSLDLYHFLTATLVRVVYIGISVVIFWQKADDLMAYLLSISLLAFSVTAVWVGSVASSHPLMARPIDLLQVVGQTGLLLSFFIFPDGRFVPRWARWPTFITLTALILSRYSLWFRELGNNFGVIWIFFTWLLACGPLQIYRYRRVSTPTQRQQTKWAVAGIAGFILLAGGTWAVSYSFLPSVVPSVQEQSTAGLVYQLIRIGIQNIGTLALPICLAVAVLRYRLWDIDVIIRKTLVYGSLTVLLTLLYFGTVVLLQRLFGTLTGVQQSPLAVVMSTLVIAALFTPLRRRVQAVIDRRFFRKKYDAQQVLALFAQTARDETDMEVLTAELLTVVQETMQPDVVNLWFPGQTSGQEQKVL